MVLKVRRLTFLTVALATATFVNLPWAQGAFGDLRLTVEPGIGSLTVQSQGRTTRDWGALGAFSVGIGVADLVGLQIHADQKLFLSQHPLMTAKTWGVTMVYNLDVSYVSPYVELGAGTFRLSQGKAAYGPQWVPILGAGCDWRASHLLRLGVGIRYHAVFDSVLLDNPGYSTVNARVGLAVDPF